jgi:type I restriction enzyme S subunit
VIDELKPYPEYRESTLAAMGSIPAHWNELRAKYLYREVDERSATGEEVLCSVSHKTGVTPRMASVTMFLAESTVGHKICRPNDVVINTLWAWMAALGVAKQIGLVSPAYGVYRPLADSQLLPAFADQILRTPPYKREYMARSTGVNASRLRLYPESFLRIPILFPPPAEQAGIVRFLGAVDRKVNRFIRAKRRLIEVLTEQKQAIITHAVTKGLNPHAPLKPSGIDWLGDVPEHWEVLKLKRIASINPSRAESFHLRDSEEPAVFLPMERVTAEGAVDASQRQSVRSLWKGFTYFRRCDVVVAKITPCFENGKGACLDELPTEIGFGTTEFIVLRAGPLVDAAFLYQLTMLTQFRQLGVESMTGSAGQQRVSSDFVANFVVAIPPLDEQHAIVSHVREGVATTFDAAIVRARREIDLIREYRTRLVADVVTGKVDVRAAAAAIPNDSELTPLQLASDEIVADDDISADVPEDESGVGVAADGEDEA